MSFDTSGRCCGSQRICGRQVRKFNFDFWPSRYIIHYISSKWSSSTDIERVDLLIDAFDW